MINLQPYRTVLRELKYEVGHTGTVREDIAKDQGSINETGYV